MGATRLPSSRRLMIGTSLAFLAFVVLVLIGVLHTVFHEPSHPEIIDGIRIVIVLIAGTYWGRHA